MFRAIYDAIFFLIRVAAFLMVVYLVIPQNNTTNEQFFMHMLLAFFWMPVVGAFLFFGFSGKRRVANASNNPDNEVMLPESEINRRAFTRAMFISD